MMAGVKGMVRGVKHPQSSSDLRSGAKGVKDPWVAGIFRQRGAKSHTTGKGHGSFHADGTPMRKKKEV